MQILKIIHLDTDKILRDPRIAVPRSTARKSQMIWSNQVIHTWNIAHFQTIALKVVTDTISIFNLPLS